MKRYNFHILSSILIAQCKNFFIFRATKDLNIGIIYADGVILLHIHDMYMRGSSNEHDSQSVMTKKI